MRGGRKRALYVCDCALMRRLFISLLDGELSHVPSGSYISHPYHSGGEILSLPSDREQFGHISVYPLSNISSNSAHLHFEVTPINALPGQEGHRPSQKFAI